MDNTDNSLPKILFADPSKSAGGPQQVGITILKTLNQDKYHLILGSPIAEHPMATDIIEFRLSPEIYNIGRPKTFKEFFINVLDFPMKVISLSKFIRKHKIDLIHSNNEICFTTSLAAKLTRTKHVIHVHGLGFHNTIFRYILGKFINSSCDKIVAVSDAVAKKLIEIGIEEQKLLIFYNGIDTSTFKPTKKTRYVHTKFGLPKHRRLIAMISALDPRKGHELFINAAQYAIQHNHNIHFLIIGNHSPEQENYKKHLINKVRELGLTDNFCFTGYKDNIPKILNSIDLLIQPSLTDAGPLVPLEAMSCGTPVIATNVGGNPEEILHGHTGIIIPANNPELLGQSIIKLIEDQELINEMRHNGRKWIKSKFDSTLLTDNIESMYDELLYTQKVAE